MCIRDRSRAILHCAHSDKITIDTYCQIANNIPTVCMIFQDTGFGSSDEDMKRIRNNSFNNKFENAHTRDHSHLALDDIKRIITANHGKYSIYHDNQNGNTIEISFTVYKKLVLQPIAQSSSIGKA